MILCRSGLCLPVPATVVNKLYLTVKRKKQSFDDGNDSASVGPSTTQGQTQQQGNLSLDAVVNEFATADKNRIVLVYNMIIHEICCLFTVANFMKNWAQRALKLTSEGVKTHKKISGASPLACCLQAGRFSKLSALATVQL